MNELYETLGVRKTATFEQIKAAYRTRCKIHHPDAGGSDEEMARVNFAYSVLKDSSRRKLYDSTGATDNNLIQKEAEGRLVQLFADILKQHRLEQLDVFAELRKKVDNDSFQIGRGIEQAAAQVKRLALLKRRVKKGDFFIGVFQGLINGERHKIQQLKVTQQISKRMQEMLAGCEWEFEAKPAETVYPNMNSTDTWRARFNTIRT